MSWSRVDLPLPEGPTIATYSPRLDAERDAAKGVHRPGVHRVVLAELGGDEQRRGHVASERNVAAIGARAASHAG